MSLGPTTPHSSASQAVRQASHAHFLTPPLLLFSPAQAHKAHKATPESLDPLADLPALEYLRVRGLEPLEKYDVSDARNTFFPRDVRFLATLARSNKLRELHLIDLIQPSQVSRRPEATPPAWPSAGLSAHRGP